MQRAVHLPADHTAAVVILDHGEFLRHGEGGVILNPSRSTPIGANHLHIIIPLDKSVFGDTAISP